MSPALYLADTSGLFRLLQAKTGEAWDEQLAAGVIATIWPKRSTTIAGIDSVSSAPSSSCAPCSFSARERSTASRQYTAIRR